MRAIFFILLVALLSPNAIAQPGWNVEIVGQGMADGQLKVSAFSDNYEYIITEKSSIDTRFFHTVDFNHPGDPSDLGCFHTDMRQFYLLLAHDSLLFAASNEKVLIFNIANRANPVLLDSTSNFLGIRKVVGHNNYLAVKQFRYLSILNFTDPLNPVQIDSMSITGYMWDYAFHDSFLVITQTGSDYMGQCFINTYNIADIENPILVSEIETGDVISLHDYKIDFIDNSLCLYYGINGLRIFDYSDPANPFQLATFMDDVQFFNILGSDHYCYAVYSPDNQSQHYLVVIDFTDPSNAYVISETRFNGRPWQMDLSESRLYISTSSLSIVSYDIFDPYNPALSSYYLPGSDLKIPVVSGNYAYVLDRLVGGFRTVDINNPVLPVAINSYEDEEFADIAVYGNYLIAAVDRLKIISIQEPDNPIYMGETPPMRWYTRMKIVNNRLYATFHAGAFGSWNGGFVIYDISDTTNPGVLSVYDDPEPHNWFFSIAINDTIAYTLEEDLGVGIYNVADPQNIQLITHYPWPSGRDWSGGIEYSNNTIFVASHQDVFFSLDVSDPYNPVLLDSTSYNAINYFKLMGNIAILSRDDEITGIDISNPMDLQAIMSIPAPSPRDIFVSNDTIYAGTRDNGLWVLHYTGPQGIGSEQKPPYEFKLYGNYPNPFNAQTTIRYSLPESGPVTLTIYNLLGQKVATLFDGTQTVGEYSLVWDAKNQPSGVYFCRLYANKAYHSETMLLLK